MAKRHGFFGTVGLPWNGREVEMFWKMLILVSENGEVACIDTTLHWPQQHFFLVSQFPRFLVFLCFTLPMFRFYFPIGILFHSWVVTFLGPVLFELFSGSSLKMGPPFGMIQIKTNFKCMVIFSGSHFPYCILFGVGNSS